MLTYIQISIPFPGMKKVNYKNKLSQKSDVINVKNKYCYTESNIKEMGPS